MLLVVHHHARNANHTGLLHGFTQQRIDPFALGNRFQKIGAFQQHKRNLAGLDKGLDLDGLRALRERCLYFIVTQHHIVTVVNLDAFDNVFTCNLLAGALVDALVAHGVHGPPVKPVEVNTDILRSRVQGNRYVDKSKADGTLPDHSWHKSSFFK